MTIWTPGTSTRHTARTLFSAASPCQSASTAPDADGAAITDATTPPASWFARPRRPLVIVIGNGKGGTGKSTTAIHLVAALMRDGHKVGAIDLDDVQGTLTRYFRNRRLTAAHRRIVLPQPFLGRLTHGGCADGASRLTRTLEELFFCNFVVIDTPGGGDVTSQLAHSFADTLVTPLGDSPIDLASLAEFDAQTQAVSTSSAYATMVQEQRRKRSRQGGGPGDWIVTRNRPGLADGRTGHDVNVSFEILARRLNFRLLPGLGERAIFRELYALGLTLFDIRDRDGDVEPAMSHIRALREVRTLVDAIGLVSDNQFPKLSVRHQSGPAVTASQLREMLPGSACGKPIAERSSGVERRRKPQHRAQPCASLLTLANSIRQVPSTASDRHRENDEPFVEFQWPKGRR